MKVTDIEVGKLLPYWNNARNNDKTVEKIVTSIKEYGFTVPLVVNKDMVLITGHARLKAAKKLGLKTVPCVLVDMTEDQAKKYRIADNKIQESTEWNEEALFKELREIGDPMELVNMGFELKEIEDIVGDIDSLVEDAEEMAQAIPEYTVSAQKPIEGDKYMPPMQNGDSDCGVCESETGAWRRKNASYPRCSPSTSAPHPDDQCGNHFRFDSVSFCHGRRSQSTHRDGYGGSGRYVGFYLPYDVYRSCHLFLYIY